MEIINFTQARSSLKRLVDKAIDDNEAVIIKRRKGEAVMVASIEDLESVLETLHLISNPNNAERLYKSIAELNGELKAGSDTE